MSSYLEPETPQPSGGSSSSNQGTPNTSANAWPIKLIDSGGVNIAAVDAAGDVSVDVNNFPATQTVAQATAANLNATVTGTVISNIGTTNGLALDSSVNALSLTQSSTTSGEKGVLSMGAVTTLSPTYTTAQTNPLSLTTAGSLRTTDNADGPVTAGTVAANSILIGGQFNTTSPAPTNGQQVALQIDGSGNLKTSAASSDGTKSTYSAASAVAFAAATTATDIFTIFGSATKLIRVHKITFTATQTTAGDINILLIKRSTANSGGTSATATNVPHDSNNAAATATVLNYTANPTTLGTTVGTVRQEKYFAPAAAAASAEDVKAWNFGDGFGQAIVLRGTAQGLCINLNSATVAGSSINCWIEWTEE